MEVRKFSVHENALRTLITKQAGTLDKAVLELAMNSVEAGATQVAITLNSTKLVVTDDGHGFATRTEIEEAFEVFGKSDERAQEVKRWAQFQIGRGQAFNFGKTTYRTNTFEMCVDLAQCPKEITYTLTENLENIPGCTVTVDLYRELAVYELSNELKNIERNVRYVETLILLDGRQINKSPIFEQWDLITDEAYIKFSEDASGADVYNLGAYVENAYVQSVGGIIVSRKQLSLNSSRNQVDRSCPVFRAINVHFEKRAGTTLLKKKTFKPEDVERIFERVTSGAYSRSEVLKLPMFRDTNSKRWSIMQISKMQSISFDIPGSRLADVAMQTRRVVVLNREYAQKALRSYDDAGSYEKLQDRMQSIAYVNGPNYLTTEELYASLDRQDTVYTDDDLDQDERIGLRLLNSALNKDLIKDIQPPNSYHRYAFRQTSLGLSPGYEAWTDGETYITYDRKYFAKHRRSLVGWAHILRTMCHEYAHCDGEKTHDSDFYERFHDTIDAFTKPLYALYSAYIRELKAAGIDLPAKIERETIEL